MITQGIGDIVDGIFGWLSSKNKVSEAKEVTEQGYNAGMFSTIISSNNAQQQTTLIVAVSVVVLTLGIITAVVLTNRK